MNSGPQMITELESKVESQQAATLSAIADVAKELHGLTVELRHDREETKEIQSEVKLLRDEIVDLRINQAGLKDLKAALGKVAYLITGGIVTTVVGVTLAIIKLT